MHFHHIGIVTKDIGKTLEYIENTYINIKSINDVVYDGLQDANLCIVTLVDNTNIELVCGE